MGQLFLYGDPSLSLHPWFFGCDTVPADRHDLDGRLGFVDAVRWHAGSLLALLLGCTKARSKPARGSAEYTRQNLPGIGRIAVILMAFPRPSRVRMNENWTRAVPSFKVASTFSFILRCKKHPRGQAMNLSPFFLSFAAPFYDLCALV